MLADSALGTMANPFSSARDFDYVRNSSLHQLAREGDTTAIRMVMESSGYKASKKVNFLDENKVSPLHYAARHNHLDVIKLLVEFGADVNIRGDDGLTPLHYAARFKISQQMARKESRGLLVSTYLADKSSHYGIGSPAKELALTTANLGLGKLLVDPVIRYLSEMGAIVNEKDKYGLTPLHYACMRGNDEATEELVTLPGINIEARDEQALTPLHMACIYGHFSCARNLIDAGANLITRDEKGQSALHKACTLGNPKLVKLILKHMEDKFGSEGVLDFLNHEDDDQNTPLLVCVESGSYESAKILVENGADVNHCNEDTMYPLHVACTVGSLEIVEILIRSQATINSLNKNFQTPLHVASANNKYKIIEYLLEKGANIERMDKDSFTPLLLAAYQGRPQALQLLLEHGASISVLDKEDKSAIYLAADQNKIDCLMILLKQKNILKMIEVNDRYDNTPLHIACSKGYLEVAEALLDAGAQIDNKNEDEQTPLHLASKFGRIRIVREILERDSYSVNDEDYESQTPLHLACIHGHYKVVSTLIQAMADIQARNCYLWTPLDCAAAYGWVKCARYLINAGAPIDPVDKNKTTPLHLAARYGHESMAELLILKGASLSKTDLSGKNALVLAISHGNRDVVSVIISSEEWKDALRNEFVSAANVRETPVRLLIKRFPDLAKDVFDKCITSNIHSSRVKKIKAKTVAPEDPLLKIVMDYEFIDDTYSVMKDLNDDDDSEDEDVLSINETEVWDETGRLLPNSEPYTKSSNAIKKNHPLNIMAREMRTELLGHPLCMALVRYKWNKFGRYAFYFNLIYYSIFVAVFTEYMLSSPRPYSPTQLIEHAIDPNLTVVQEMKSGSYNFSVYQECNFVRENLHLKKSQRLQLSQLGVMIVASTRIVFELFQILQTLVNNALQSWRKMSYFGIDNTMDMFCYVTSILVVTDFGSCENETGLRNSWQWPLGAVCVTVTWLNLLSLIRKLPYLGIYVVMFTDVFQTFLKVSGVVFLFVIAFSLGFYALLENQQYFGDLPKAIIKTFVMTSGELEYDNIFFADEFPINLQAVPYEWTTRMFFIVFVIIMPIIIMNLLVGLAVDDIKAVQENAVLQRLAMQVELTLNVEKLLPECLRRNWVIRTQTLEPNRRSNMIWSLLKDESTMRNIAQRVISECSGDAIGNLQARQDDLLGKVASMKSTVRDIQKEMERTNTILTAIAIKTGLRELEEDEI